MTWTDETWHGFALLLDEWWKDDLPDTAEQAWKLALDDVEPVVAVATLKRLLREGGTWRPSVAEFVAALDAGPVGVLSFEEAWPAIHAAMSRFDPWDADKSEQRVLEWVRPRSSDHVAGWLASYGVRRLALEPVDDPEFGGAVLHRLRENYRELTANPGSRDRLVRALEEAPRREGLRRFDPGLLPERASS